MDPSREAYWTRKLRPIRLGAEPVESQLARRFNVTVAISSITLVIDLIMLAIFTAFDRFDIGLRFFGLIFTPAIVWYWLDYATLRLRALRYLSERGDLFASKTTRS